jgi:TonB family protein
MVLTALGAAGARAATAAPDDAGADAPADAGGADGGAPAVDFGAPPVPLERINPAYPPEAQRARVSGDVVLLLTIDDQGAVTAVEVEAGLPAGLTESATAAARALRFRPATDGAGHPMAARLRWTVHFTLPEVRTPAAPAPAPPPAPTAPAPVAAPLPPNVERLQPGPDGLLAVTVRERGTGKALPLATLWIEDVGELIRVDAAGRASRVLPPGAYAVTVRAPGHHQEERIERLHPGEHLARSYFIEKERLNEYETRILTAAPRAETGVVSLQAEEIHDLPGTFGDPFRAVMLLPGVGSPLSGLGYPVIRGEAPGQTGTFIDDVKVPLLYHVGFLSAVVHPNYLDSLEFRPGDFPAEFGRFTGGLIRAHTTPAPTEAETTLQADLLELSAFHAQPFTVAGHEAAVSAAARYGSLGFLARALGPDTVLKYWDFQTRADLRLASGTLRLLIFGANDAAGTAAHDDASGVAVPENVLHVGFNRADLRYRMLRRGPLGAEVGIEAGPDYTNNTDVSNPAQITEWIVRPRAAADLQLGSRLKLRAGADTLLQIWNLSLGGPLAQTVFPHDGLTYGAFVQAEWQPTPAWLVVPGVRGDLYDYRFQDGNRTVATSLDPRLAVRRRLAPGLHVKVAGGIYHSPPRFLVPWPGLEGFGLRENGLNRSDQISAGVEALLPGDVSLDAQVYFNWLPRVSEYDFMQNTNDPINAPPVTGGLPGLARAGRAYGLEIIARRRLGHRLFGWLTYTRARAERLFDRIGWRPADFDQPQIVNAVVSYALGRSWTVAGTFHMNSGRPVTPPIETGGPPFLLDNSEEARNSDRLPSFWRVDFRIEKREAFDTWYLDFYVDWLNISLQREITSYVYGIDPQTGAITRRGVGTILTIPTMGLRATF